MTQPPPPSGHGPEPGRDPGAPGGPGGTSGPGGTGQAGRDPWLAGFAQHGPGDTCPPGPALAALVADLSGPGWRCDGATDDELMGLMGRWAALESWAAAGKLGVTRELLRRRAVALPGTVAVDGLPEVWDEGTGHEVAAALSVSLQGADKLASLAWTLQARLPGIGAKLADGTIDIVKAGIIAKELFVLDDAQAAQAEALIVDELAGKTPGQIGKLAAAAVLEVDLEGARPNLTLPLATLLGLAERPGEGHGLGPLDPALVRDLAAAAARSPHSTWCVTITGPGGHAIGHGCARPVRKKRSRPRPPPPGSRDGPWSFTRNPDDPGPPDGYGTWTLTLPGGQQYTVKLGPVPLDDCDHRYESHAYEPSATLRHLVEIRDGECTFPCCSRHAGGCDFEHAVPYDKGGRTCACNAGARSRRCHKVKQSKGWTVTQPRPSWHQWTTPSGRSYTQGPKRYPA
jgi:hypothetical protein